MKYEVIYKPYKNLGAQKPFYPCPQRSMDELTLPVLSVENTGHDHFQPSVREQWTICAVNLNFGVHPFGLWCLSQACVCQLHLF